MPVICSTRRARMISGSEIGAASTLAIRGTAGGLIVTLESAARIASAAGCIRAQWKGALTGSSTARRAPKFGAKLPARSTGPLAPEIHPLPRRIVIGGFAPLAFGGGLRELLRLGEIGAEQRRHRPFAHGHRLLHG